MPNKIAVVGQGYVGLPLAMAAVEAGYDVVGLDADESRVKLLESGTSYIGDVSDSRLSAALRTGRYLPTANPADLASFDCCVLSVPTPLTGTGSSAAPDLTALTHATANVAPHVRRGCVVVVESTSYPGTTEDIVGPLLEQGSGLSAGADFALGFSPERIDPGNPQWHLQNMPKVVSGVDAASLAKVKAFYDSIVEQTVSVSSPRTAELSKLLENTFRQVNIALVNELAQVAGEMRCDLPEAIAAAATKPFGYMPFQPGPGVGGHCLPIDSVYLSWYAARVAGRPLRLVELANRVNRTMPSYVVQRVGARIRLAGARVLLLGLGYKRNSADLRESPALKVARLLHQQRARVRVCDPLAPVQSVPADLDLVTFSAEEVAGAEAVVILTDHDCFDYELVQRTAPYVFDTRRQCYGANVDHL